MWNAIKALALILLGIVLGEVLSPVLGPVLRPALPTMGGLIQSAMASQTEASLTVAIRYAAAGYQDPADVLLTLMGLLIVAGVVAMGVVGLKRLLRPIQSAPTRYVLSAPPGHRHIIRPSGPRRCCPATCRAFRAW
jgi:hypothetical protein